MTINLMKYFVLILVISYCYFTKLKKGYQMKKKNSFIQNYNCNLTDKFERENVGII